MTVRRLLVIVALVGVASTALLAQAGLVGTINKKVPKPLQQRFLTGDPVWRELPVRADFQGQYDRVWQTAVNTVLEHNFDIATMDKESGYVRTNVNERIVKLDTNWFYKVQISIKLVSIPGDPRTNPPKLPIVEKVRLQVSGEVTNVDKKGVLKQDFLGYDRVLLETLFQDLQAKLGGA